MVEINAEEKINKRDEEKEETEEKDEVSKNENGTIRPLNRESIAQRSGDDSIILTSRPKNIQRHISIMKGIGGIPIIREVIIIETEPSTSKILAVVASLGIYALILQVIFSFWMKYHKRSCKFATLLIIWLFPPIFAFIKGVYFFLLLWLVYNFFNANIGIQIFRKPMKKDVPRKTYAFFRNIFLISYFSAIIGQIGTIICFLRNYSLIVHSLILLIFSLYFGLISRDLIETISEIMALKLGYYSKEGVPEKTIKQGLCSICDNAFNDKEKTHTLICSHSFHEFCIKGWCFIGRKGFCPQCREKVDFKSIPVDKWQKGEIIYTQLLDILRNVIILCLTLVLVGIYYRYRSVK